MDELIRFELDVMTRCLANDRITGAMFNRNDAFDRVHRLPSLALGRAARHSRVQELDRMRMPAKRKGKRQPEKPRDDCIGADDQNEGKGSGAGPQE